MCYKKLQHSSLQNAPLQGAKYVVAQVGALVALIGWICCSALPAENHFAAQVQGLTSA